MERSRQQPALTELELVCRALAFENRRSVKSWFAFVGQLQSPLQDDERDPPPSEGMQAELHRFQAALTAIIKGQLAPARIDAWCRIASGVLPIATYSPNGAVSTTYRYLQVEHFAGPEPDGLFALVLVWMLDPQRPFGRRLCQCQWKDCGRFFLAARPKRGRPQRLYCPGTDHMTKAHDANAADRVRKSRDRRKKTKAKRRK